MDLWNDAHAQLERVISIDPYSFFAHLILEPVAYHVENIDGFLKSIKFCIPFEDSVHRIIQEVADEEGIEGALIELLSQIEIMGPASFQRPVHMANRFSWLNQHDKAMDLLEQGFAIMEKLNLPLPEN